MDIDTTVKHLYGKQEGAEVGYNSKKPGHPSHTYHSYLVSGLRLVLDAEVLAGDQSHAKYTIPGLERLLDELINTNLRSIKYYWRGPGSVTLPGGGLEAEPPRCCF
ncbi:MAG: hypothetical protein H7832_06825 [Magnetococcus sp. DMHC-6]